MLVSPVVLSFWTDETSFNKSLIQSNDEAFDYVLCRRVALDKPFQNPDAQLLQNICELQDCKKLTNLHNGEKLDSPLPNTVGTDTLLRITSTETMYNVSCSRHSWKHSSRIIRHKRLHPIDNWLRARLSARQPLRVHVTDN